MAKGRTRNRMELREQHEAAEAREREARTGGEDEDQDQDLGVLPGGADEADEGDAEAAPVKKAKKKKAVAEPKPRKKTVKVVRKRVVWVVFDNSSKKVAQFDYAKRADADALVEKLKAEKKQTYFVQPVKEEITE